MSGLPWGLYVRVSTEEQAEEGQSIDAQRRALHAWAKDNGFAARTFEDKGKSAYTENLDKRPAFKQMLEAARSGELAGVAVTHIDRFSRKLIVLLSTLGEFGQLDMGFVSLENSSFDFSRATDRLQLVVLGGFAEYYSAELSRKVKRGMFERAAKGLHVGNTPFGFCDGKCMDCWNRETETSNCESWGTVRDGDPFLLHGKDAPGVELAFRLYGNGGQSDSTIAHLLNEKGYRSRTRHGRVKWNRYSVAWMLRNPTYVGIVAVKGKEFPARHPAIVTRELFEAVQAVRSQNNRRRAKHAPRRHHYLFNGLLYCAVCNEPMHAITYGKVEAPTRAYLCRSQERLRGDIEHTHSFVRAEPVETQFAELLMNIVLPENWRERIVESLGSLPRALDPDAERRRLKQKLERIKILYEEGDKTLAEYRSERDAVRADLNALNAEPEHEVIDAGIYLETLGTVWTAATLTERRDIVRSLVTRIVVDPGTKRLLSFIPKPAFLPFFRQLPNVREIDGVVEFICPT